MWNKKGECKKGKYLMENKIKVILNWWVKRWLEWQIAHAHQENKTNCF
jgi:hypothetical protein